MGLKVPADLIENGFPTEIALFKALYLAVAEAEKRWTMRTRNWQEIMAQLSIFFQERLKDYLC